MCLRHPTGSVGPPAQFVTFSCYKCRTLLKPDQSKRIVIGPRIRHGGTCRENMLACRFPCQVGLFEWGQVERNGLRMMGLLVAAPHGRRGRATPLLGQHKRDHPGVTIVPIRMSITILAAIKAVENRSKRPIVHFVDRHTVRRISPDTLEVP